MTIQQMAQLYWRAKVYKLNVSCGGASNYGVAGFSTAFNNFNWDELDTPSSNLEYYQQASPGDDVPQDYPEDQPDNDVPWMVVVPVYQVFDTDAAALQRIPGTGYFYYEGLEGYMIQESPAWELRLFEWGAMRIGDTYYPSVELTLATSQAAGCGAVVLNSIAEALP